MGFLSFLKNQVLSTGKAVSNSVQAGASLISPKLGKSVSKLINSPAAQFLNKAVNQVSKIIKAVEEGTPADIVKEVKTAVSGLKRKPRQKKVLKKTLLTLTVEEIKEMERDIAEMESRIEQIQLGAGEELTSDEFVEIEELEDNIMSSKRRLRQAARANPQPKLSQNQISDIQLKDLQGRAAGGVL